MKDRINRVVERLKIEKMVVTEEIWKPPHLWNYSPFQDISREEKDKLVATSVEDVQLDRAMGCIVGMAVGDALGHHPEFLPAVDEPGSTGHSYMERGRCQVFNFRIGIVRCRGVSNAKNLKT